MVRWLKLSTLVRGSHVQILIMDFCSQQYHDNALSRLLDFELRPEDDTWAQQSHCLLRPDQLQMFTTCMLLDDSLLSKIANEMAINAFLNEIIASINQPSKKKQRSDITQFSVRDGPLYQNNLLSILGGACRTQVLQNRHENPEVILGSQRS